MVDEALKGALKERVLTLTDRIVQEKAYVENGVFRDLTFIQDEINGLIEAIGKMPPCEETLRKVTFLRKQLQELVLMAVGKQNEITQDHKSESLHNKGHLHYAQKSKKGSKE
jgi:hypothetical protein